MFFALDQLVPGLITVVASLTASSGFWAYRMKKVSMHDALTKLLLGLAHDRIVYIGMSFIDRGSCTKDEYEDFITYLYTPYKETGGNGLAEKIVSEVSRLPITQNSKVLN